MRDKIIKWVLLGIAELIILLLVFRLGEIIGLRKANFSYNWGDNYYRVFGGPRLTPNRTFSDRGYLNAHGAVGTVLKIDTASILIKDRNNVEKAFNISTKTTIKKDAEVIKISDVEIGEPVVIIGVPRNDGTIDAEFIRVFDPEQTSVPLPTQTP